MNELKLKVSTDSFINSKQANGRQQRTSKIYARVEPYFEELRKLRVAGLSWTSIHEWLELNEVKVSYSWVYARLDEILVSIYGEDYDKAD